MKNVTKTRVNGVLKKGVSFTLHGRKCTVIGINIATQVASLDFDGKLEEMGLNEVRLSYNEYVKGIAEPQPIEKQPEPVEMDWHGKGEKMDEITNFDEMQFSFLGVDDFLVSIGDNGTVVFEREGGEIVGLQQYVEKSVRTHSEKTGLTKFFVRVHNGRVYAL